MRLAVQGLRLKTAETSLGMALVLLGLGAANRWATPPRQRVCWWLARGSTTNCTPVAGATGAVRQAALAFSRAAVLAWPAVAALRFRRIYNKRVSLGLADPVVATGFWCSPSGRWR